MKRLPTYDKVKNAFMSCVIFSYENYGLKTKIIQSGIVREVLFVLSEIFRTNVYERSNYLTIALKSVFFVR